MDDAHRTARSKPRLNRSHDAGICAGIWDQSDLGTPGRRSRSSCLAMSGSPERRPIPGVMVGTAASGAVSSPVAVAEWMRWQRLDFTIKMTASPKVEKLRARGG